MKELLGASPTPWTYSYVRSDGLMNHHQVRQLLQQGEILDLRFLHLAPLCSPKDFCDPCSRQCRTTSWSRSVPFTLFIGKRSWCEGCCQRRGRNLGSCGHGIYCELLYVVESSTNERFLESYVIEVRFGVWGRLCELGCLWYSVLWRLVILSETFASWGLRERCINLKVVASHMEGEHGCNEYLRAL